MIISHKHKFIFIHIMKCAGTTISHSLLNNLYFKLPRKDDWKFDKLNTNIAEVFKAHPDARNSRDPRAGQHSKYCEAQKYLSECDLNINEYFTFSFVKNPWHRCVSMYEYGKKQQRETDCHWPKKFKNLKFKEFLYKKHGCQLGWVSSQVLENDSPKQHNVLVDFIGRFENLQEDFNTICDKIGIPQQKLPHKNKTNHKHYTEYYDDETRQIVAEKFAKDIEYFGYEFGE